MRRREKTAAMMVALLAVASMAHGDEPDAFASWERLERAALVNAVLDRNPTLEAVRRAWLAASQRAEQVSALEQPEVSYAFAPLSVSGGVTFGQMFEISQAVPLGGRRDARAAIAAAEVAGAEGEVETVRLELARRVELLFVDYSFLAESVRINEEHLMLLDDLLRAATSSYASGRGSQQDPLQAESEQAHLLHEGVRLRSRQSIVAAQINKLLHRAPQAPLPPPLERAVEEVAGAPVHAEIDAEAIERSALETRPELRAVDAAVDARRAELDLAQRDRQPGLSVMTSYESMWSDREHRWLVGASIGVPLWRRPLRAAVAEAEARLLQAESESEVSADEVRGEVWIAAEGVRESKHILDLYRSRTLPIAVDRVEVALAGYRSGTDDFVAVIEAQRNRRQVELGYQEALADFDRNRVELARATGAGATVLDPLTVSTRTSSGDQP